MSCNDYRDDIDLCALGTLLPDEAERVRTHASTCESCRLELLAAENAAARLALAAPRVRAPSALRTAVLDAIRQEEPAPADRPAATARTRRAAAVRGLVAHRYRFAAALAVLVPVAGLALWVATLQREVNGLREDTVEIQRRNDGLLLLAVPSSAKADFRQVGNARGATGAVTWSPERQVCYAIFDNLPEPEAGATYRLWYVVDGERVIDAGEIAPDDHGKAIAIIDASRWRGQDYDLTLKQERRPHDPEAPALLIARLRRP